jgi:hypothetical protein
VAPLAQIDWTRAVLFRPLASAAGLLGELAAMPAAERDARHAYLRHIRSWLVYDTPAIAQRDAPSAFITELEHRFLAGAGDRGGEARPGAGGELLCDLENRSNGAPRCHHASS